MSSTHAVMEIVNKTQWQFQTSVWDYRPILIGTLLTMTSNGHSENFITSKYKTFVTISQQTEKIIKSVIVFNCLYCRFQIKKMFV